MRRTVRSIRRAVQPPQDRAVRRVERRGLPHGRGVARLAAAAGARFASEFAGGNAVCGRARCCSRTDAARGLAGHDRPWELGARTRHLPIRGKSAANPRGAAAAAAFAARGSLASRRQHRWRRR